METLFSVYLKLKRLFLHGICSFISDKTTRRSLVSRATFPKFDLNPDTTKYNKIINVAFCFNEGFIPFALTTMSSLLENSPGCKYDIYCVTDINKDSQAKIQKYISERYSNGNIIFLKPNKDYDKAYCGRWSHAIWWRCMLPKLLPDTVERIIYADVDTIFVRDLREANEFEMGTDLLAGCFDSPTYINSGFIIMNIKQIRLEDTYSQMVNWATNNQTGCPDQDMLNTVCRGRIRPISRKFNVIIVAGYSFLKTMTISQYRDLRKPVMLHYAELKPWDTNTKKFFTVDIYSKYYNAVINNFVQ